MATLPGDFTGEFTAVFAGDLSGDLTGDPCKGAEDEVGESLVMAPPARRSVGRCCTAPGLLPPCNISIMVSNGARAGLCSTRLPKQMT